MEYKKCMRKESTCQLIISKQPQRARQKNTNNIKVWLVQGQGRFTPPIRGKGDMCHLTTSYQVSADSKMQKNEISSHVLAQALFSLCAFGRHHQASMSDVCSLCSYNPSTVQRITHLSGIALFHIFIFCDAFGVVNISAAYANLQRFALDCIVLVT